MVRRAVIALVAATAAFSSRAWAAPDGRARVAVDWSGVTDADVARCGLSRLRAGTIERLVDNGHALVGARDPGALGVQVTSVGGGLRIHVEGHGVARDESLKFPEPCDASFVLDVIARIAELVGEVARRAPALRHPPPVPSRPAREPSADWQGELDFTARANDTAHALFGGGLSARRRFVGGWESGLRAELTGNGARGVTVLETFAGVSAAWQAHRRGAGPYLELGPLLHYGTSDALSALELDAQLGAGLQVSAGHVLAQVLLTGRLRRFEHRVGPEIAFDTGHIGVTLRIGGQLFDP